MQAGARAQRAVLLLAALGVVSPVASAYYYYVFFANGSSPYIPLPAHYDLKAIKDSTIQYFISDLPPGPLIVCTMAGMGFALFLILRPQAPT